MTTVEENHSDHEVDHPPIDTTDVIENEAYQLPAMNNLKLPPHT